MPYKHKEDQKRYNARYLAANRERLRAHKRAFYAANREHEHKRQRANYLHHAEHRRLDSLSYRQAHLEERRAYEREYSRSHRAEKRNHDREHKRSTSRMRVRRALQHSTEPALTEIQWEAIKAAYRYRCAYCGDSKAPLTQDHVVPISKGGPHTIENIVPACRRCNTAKWINAPIHLPAKRLML